jgi:hypothetical protein
MPWAQWRMDSVTLLTVAGTVPEWSSWKNFTGFPFHSHGEKPCEHLNARGVCRMASRASNKQGMAPDQHQST